GQAVVEKLRGEDSPLVDLFRHAPTREYLRQFEKTIEDASYVKDFAQPRVQLALTRWGRVGNKRAVVGRAGWLYYAPGIAHVGGPSFVDPDVIRARETETPDDGAEPMHPDPRPAILDFHRMLAARGIA